VLEVADGGALFDGATLITKETCSIFSGPMDELPVCVQRSACGTSDIHGESPMNRLLLATVTIVLLTTSVPSHTQQLTTKDQIIGTWRVLSLKGLTAGLVKYPLGGQPAGYLTVTATRIWLLFVDSRRAAPTSAALTDPEAIAAMKTSVAWTGQYTIGEQSPDGLKATARVDTASSPALPGTDRVYFMKVEGNKLTMKSPGVIEPMTGVTSALVIELVKAD
jgi:hypothetical protein